MDETYVEAIAQRVLKIAENAIKNVENAAKNAFKGNAGCASGACVDFKTGIDHVDVVDIVYPGYTFWYDEHGNIGARCKTLIKLFKLIENRYADFAWYGELSRYTIRTSFGELEIEYR